jgi:hypothetical protein
MIISTTSTCASSFVLFQFEKEFFDHFDLNVDFIGKFMLKPIANVLRLNSDSVEKCILNSENDQLIMRFQCNFGIVKVFSLNYEDTRMRRAIYDKVIHRWSVYPKALLDMLINFQSDDQVNLISSDSTFIISNHVEDQSEQRALNTQVTIDLNDFEVYPDQIECKISISLKELKVI